MPRGASTCAASPGAFFLVSALIQGLALSAAPAAGEWQCFSPRERLLGPVSAMLEGRSGNLWFAADGVKRYDDVTRSSWRFDASVLTEFEDRSGNLWIGTYRGGVLCYDGAAWRTFTTTDCLAGNSAR